MALALKARRAGEPSHRQANATLTQTELRLATLMQRAADLLASGVDSKELRAAIREANISQSIDSLPWAEHDAQLEKAVDTLHGEILDAGARTGQTLSSMSFLPQSLSAAFSFNKADPRALAWAQAQAGNLLREVSDNTRAAVREIIADSFRNNLQTNEVISRLRNTIGLNSKGAAIVSKLRDRAFDEAVLAGDTREAASAKADAQAGRMRTRLVKSRAKTVARTEILRSSNNGRYLGWTQAIEEGWAPPNVMKKWSATTASLSGMACERCRGITGEIVGWDESFSNGVLMPPAHPNCRCTALMVEPQPAQRKNPKDVTQETDYSPPAPKPIGVPRGAGGGNNNLKKPPVPDVGIPSQRRAGMGDIPVPAKDLRRGSAAEHLTADGTFTPERQALHDRIVRDHLSGVRSVPRNQMPEFEMLGGGPASGKSSALKSGVATVRDKTKAVHINADDIKELIPEVAAKIRNGETDWASFGHEESSYLAKRVLAASVEKRKNIVLDGTGDGSVDSVLSKISSARRAGYKVKGVYLTVDTDEAILRATARAKKSGRAVPSTIIRDTHAGVSKVFPQVASQFDEIVLIDNNGATPRIIARGSLNKPLDILDNGAFGTFLAKADPTLRFAPAAPKPPRVVTGDKDVIAVMTQQRKAGINLLTLSDAEVSAIVRYTSEGGEYRDINQFLRGTSLLPSTVARAEKLVTHLDRVMSKAPRLEEGIITFRGIKGDAAVSAFRKLKVGDSYTDAGYVSTSLDRGVATVFASEGLTLEIVNPAGTKGIFPLAAYDDNDFNLTSWMSEKEWLLARGTKFRVVEISGNNIKVEVVQ